MGKKRTQKASRSEIRMQKLYADALREVKERNINLDVLPAAENEDSATDDNNSLEEKIVPQKPRKKPKEVLEETIKKQEESRKPRASLCVPVSRIIPFKPNERGLEFPRDFRRDPLSLSWIPRSGSSLSDEAYNARRSPCSDFNDDLEENLPVSCKEIPEETSSSVEEILQVFPLRISEKDNASLPKARSRSQQLPPIYRQDLWRETMRRASEPSRSIPAKHDSWNMTSMSLMVGKQELYGREKCKSTVSLAERRFRLRAATAIL